MKEQNLLWHKCRMIHDGMRLEGDKLPKDGVWSYWKFKDGTILKARMKYDAQDHFWPPCTKSEGDIIAWAELTTQGSSDSA